MGISLKNLSAGKVFDVKKCVEAKRTVCSETFWSSSIFLINFSGNWYWTTSFFLPQTAKLLSCASARVRLDGKWSIPVMSEITSSESTQSGELSYFFLCYFHAKFTHEPLMFVAVVVKRAVTSAFTSMPTHSSPESSSSRMEKEKSDDIADDSSSLSMPLKTALFE